MFFSSLQCLTAGGRDKWEQEGIVICLLWFFLCVWCALFLFLSSFFFYFLLPVNCVEDQLFWHRAHQTHTSRGCYYQSRCLGYNPFEIQLSVKTHRRGWNRAWLWGVTLPRCLAQPLTLPGLQQRLHTGILVLPLVCVPTNYPFKDGMESLAPSPSLLQPSIFLFISPSQLPLLSSPPSLHFSLSLLSSPRLDTHFKPLDGGSGGFTVG